MSEQITPWREQIAEKKSNAYWVYQREQEKCNEVERNIDRWLSTLKLDGLVLMDHDDVKQAHNMLDKIDIYEEMRAWCAKVRRPYIKCVTPSWNRIVVTADIKHRGLLANLLFVAVPVTQRTEWSAKAKKFTLQKVDFLNGTGYNRKPSDDISSWVTTTTISLLFNGSRGEEHFKEWHHFMTTDRMQRIYLGLS